MLGSRSRPHAPLVGLAALVTTLVVPAAAGASVNTVSEVLSAREQRAGAPQVDITSPTAGATLPSGFAAAPIEVTANVPAAGRHNGAGIRWVRIKVIDRATGDVVAVVTDRSAPYRLSASVPDGAYRVRAVARATDRYGATRSRDAISVAIAGAASPAELASLRMINEARAAAGVGPLTLDPEMSAFARDWSITMSQGSFEHSGGPWAENIAAWWGEDGLSAEEGARRLHDLWMGSPPHYANLTNPGWTRIGVGIHHSGNGWWGTHVFE
jgi:hypothetical protein